MANSTSFPGPTFPVTIDHSEPAYILDMPNDVTALFFHYLALQSLEVSGLVCRSWNAVLGLDSVWRELLEKQFYTRTIALGAGETYQSAYRKQHRLIPNLTNFVFGWSTREIEGGNSSKLAVADERLVVANSNLFNTKIQVLDVNSLKPLRSFRTRLPKVISMSAGSGKIHFLIGKNQEREIVSANLNSVLTPGSEIEFLETPVDPRTEKIAIENEKIYVAFNQHPKIYSLESDQEEESLRAQMDTQPVTCMAIANKELYAGGNLGTIEIFNLANNVRTGFFQAHNYSPNAIAINGNYFFSCDSTELKLWNSVSHQCISSLKFYQGGFPASLAFSREKLFLKLRRANPRASSEIGIMDFTADSKAILQDIASLLEKNDPDSARFALERFSKMPVFIKRKIYAEHNKLLKNRVANEMLAAHAEDLFLREHLFSNPLRKAQAIRNFLAAPKNLEHPLEREKRERESINNQNNPPNKGEYSWHMQ